MSSILLTALFLSPLTYFATDGSAEAASIFSGTCEQSVGSSANVQATDLFANGSFYGCQIKFTAGTNSWTVPPGVTSIKLLVVGGGGGGGSHVGGGGGGGAVYENLNYPVSPQTAIPITVGAGGTGALTSGTYCLAAYAGTGGTSIFGSLNVLGGGHGASWEWQTAGTGANGGGGSSLRSGYVPWYEGGQGLASTGWSGYRGGNPYDSSIAYSYGYPGGGGAGATSNGSDVQGVAAGNGGAGKLSEITNTYFGGGGGGGFHGGLSDGRVNVAGSGGVGGGGAGKGFDGVNAPGKATSGGANTGGGGGGSGAPCANLSSAIHSEGGNGGSGVVLIQYTKPSPVMSSKPVISGTANQGTTLNTSAGSWSNSPTKYTYQWQVSADQSTWTDISGATSNEYKLTSGEATKYVRSVVTARNSNDPASAASDPIGPISSATSDACTQTVTNSSTISVTEISSNGVVTECVVKFKSGSNTWTRPAGVSSARLLLVGGGGAGGAGIGGGGGAGEMVEVPSLTLDQATYPVVVGGGGLTVTSAGPAGGNSSFTTLTAYGGGGGGFNESVGPTAPQGFGGYLFGSSGGGAFPNTSWSGPTRLWGVQDNSFRGTMLAGMTADRSNGGFGSGGGAAAATGGGGGGAGGNGGAGDTTSQAGGVGGAGKASDIMGTTQFFAAGGGGGVNGDLGALSRGIPGVGGSGIGGAGGGKAPNCTNRDSGSRDNATGGCWGYNGATNTGSGGGGASNAQFGGDGGSGVVIIRYTLAAQSALSVTPTTSTYGATPTLSTTGGSGTGSVTYEVTTTGSALCSVSGATLSFTALGTCSVKATKASQGGYLPVSSLATTFTVSQAAMGTVTTPTVIATPGAANSIDVSWSSVTNADTYYVKLFRADTNAEVASKTVTSGTSTTITSSDYASIGTIQNYKVSVGAASSTGNYVLGTQSSQVAVSTNASQSALSISTVSVIYSSATTRALSTTGGSGTGAVTYQVTTPGTPNCSITGSTLSFTAAGECTITATKAASTGYLAATTSATTFTVIPANMGTVSTPTVTATAGVLNSIDVSWTAVTNADRYQVKLTRVDTGVLVAYAFVNNATSYTLTTADYSTMSQTRNYSVTVAAYSTTGNYAEGSPSTSVAVTTNQTVTVTYSYDGATGGNSTTSNTLITGASPVTLPTPTKQDYTFIGWYSASTGGTKIGNAGASYSPTSTLTLYGRWASNLMAYEPFTGTANSNLVGGSGSGSSGLTGNWILVNALGTNSGASSSNVYTSVPSLALPTNTSFSLPSSNTAASGTGYVLRYSARQLSTPISFDTDGTYYYSFVNHVPFGSGDTGMGMVGLLSGLPSSSSDTGPWSLFTGSAYGSKFAIDYGDANKATWIAGQTRLSSSGLSAVGTKVSSPTTTSTSNFVVVKVVTSASGNDQISLRAFAPTETMPLTDSTITWDVQYAAAISGTAQYLSVQSEFNGVLDEVRVGYTYKAVTGSQTIYTVTYSYDSATGGNSTTSANFAVGGTALTLPTPTKTGYTFGGWYSEAGLSTQVGLAGDSYSPSASGTLYAKWTKNSNTVTFDPNGATGSATTQSILTDTATALTTNPFTRLGYMFSNWNTIALGGGTSYTNGQSVTINGPINLYAQWTANSNTVVFNNNTGSGTMANQSITTGQATALSAHSFTKTGYTFGGWNTASDGSGTSYTNSQSVTITGGMTLYAQWTANSNLVVFNNNGGSGSMSNQSITTGSATALTANTFTRTGYTFAGWNTVSGGTGTGYTDAQSVTITGGMTLYAQWTANTNTVTFNNNSGSGTMSNQSITSGQATALTTNTFTRTGYTFSGWNTVAGGSGTAYTNSQSVTLSGGLTLYAQWSPVTYTVTYNYNGATAGNSTATSNFVFDGTAITLPTPTKTGYTFGGWFESSSFSGSALASAYSPASSVTIYAKWTAVSYTITWDSNGGSTVTGTSTFVVTDTITEPTAPTQQGKYFGGWSTSETANQGVIANKIASWPYAPSAANLTLYAIWLDDNAISFTGTGNTSARVGANSTSVNVVPKDDSFTWEAWIYPTGFAGTGATKWSSILDNGAGGSNFGRTWLQVMDRGSGPLLGAGYWTSNGDGNGLEASANSISMNRWQHVAMTVTRTAPTIGNCVTNGAVYIKLYVDGALVKEGNDTAFYGCTNSSGLMVGDNFDDPNQQFKGKIDQVKVWSGVLTDAEVAASRMTYSNTGVDNVLRAHYDFNDLGAAPALNDVIDNIASAATTYNLSIYGANTATVTSNVSRSQNQFQVTYDANTATSGTTTTEASLNPYTSLITPGAGDLVRTGYSFGGWNTTTTGSGINFLESSTYQLLYGDQTLYSNWSADTYTVTYDYNGASGGNSTATSSYTVDGTAITLPTPTKTGYTFGGWFESSTFTGSALTSTYSPSSTRTIYAKWTANTYTVTYNYNGATGANSSVSGSFTVGGTAISLPAPTKTGYTFDGWFVSSSFTGNALASTYSPSSSLTIYAKWAANTNTVSFDNNGGSGAMSDQSITSGVSTALSSNSFTKTGYSFAGWATSANGSVIYANGASVTITGGLSLYAKWSANTNTVTFNANDGSGSPSTSSQNIVSGTSTALASNTFTKTGYTFAGWNTAANGSGTAYANSASVTILASATLYAQWTANTYTVTYDANTASGAAARITDSFTVDTTAALTLPGVGTLAKTGYTFDGWAATAGGAKLTGTYTPTANKTLYARWVANTYTVSYDANTASGVAARTTDSFTVDTTAALTLPGVGTLAKTGYTFDGWATFAGGAKLTGTYTPTADTTLFARWTANTYTVTYDGNSASGSAFVVTASYTVGNAGLTLPAVGTLSKTGYTFDGWSETVGGSKLTGTYTPTADTTLYARWTANTYTVTYNANTASGSAARTSDSFTVDTTAALTLPAVGTLAKTGYTFDGWATSAGGTKLTGTYTPTANTTLYARWTANVYTVTYGANGGTGSAARTSDSFTVDTTGLTLPGVGTLAKSGYTFDGWAETVNGTKLTGAYSPTATITLQARWVAINYNVTYSSQGSTGGAVPADALNYNIGNSATIKTNTGSLAKTGYSLVGWTVNSDGTGTVYAAGDTYVFGAGNVTLYPKWSAGTNTVTFNANDGSGSPATSTQSIVSGASTALTPNSFTRTGYTFAGWNTAANGSGTNYANSAAITVVTSITLYAKWTPDVYTVTYNANSGSGSAARTTDSYTVGTTALTLPAIGSLTRTGYTFDGWATTVGGSKISGAYTPTASVTLYARWNANTYNITYNDNSATSGSPSATSGTYTTAGTAITLATQSTMARTGYTFNGWSTTINDVSTKITNSGSYTITAPVVLYALWTAIDYSVSYSSQGFTGGTVPTDVLVYNIGDTAVVKANVGTLVKTGYTFAGWTTASDGSGTVYQSGDSITIASSNVTFYPKWTANTYTITYNSNGASGSPARSSDSYTSGTTGLSLPAVGTMAKTGYDFGGWSPSPTGSALNNNGYTTTTNHTLYAIWNLKTINYTYARGVAGGTNVTGSHIASFPSPFSLTGLYGSVINLDTTISSTAFVSPNTFQFMGWNDGSSIYAPNDPFTLGATASTFTAEWVRLYEVRYALNGGSGIIDVDTECLQVNNTCLANQAITLSAAPTRAGYTFTGWKDQSGVTYTAAAATNVTNNSFIYYAQWDAIEYTMAFNSQGGSASPAQLIKNISESFTLPSPGTKTGYTFSGWFDGTNTYGVGANYTVGTASKTFAALWTANVYTVTFNWNGGSGTSVPDVNYTYGTAAITLPNGASHSRDGYVFAGWATSQGGAAIADSFIPTADTMLYARWNDGAYAITLNAHGGTLGQTSHSISRGTSMTLPAPTREGFAFDGWYEDAAAAHSVGAANTTFSPTSSQTLHAKWVQNSLAGINPAHINSLASITVTGSHTWSGTHSASGTGAALTVPSGALPNGTVVKVSFIEDLNRPRSIIDNDYAYYTSVAVHWLTGTGDNATVPATAANKPLTLVLTNPAILPGAKVFMIIGGVATEVAEATQAGEVSIEISQDPEFVVAATKPSAPASVSASAVSGSQATVTWAAPASTGGAPITSYTVTASPGGATCTTTTLSCDVTGLASGTTYSYSVVASNVIGASGVRSTTVTYVAPPAPTTPSTPVNVDPASSGSGFSLVNANGVSGVVSSVTDALETEETKTEDQASQNNAPTSRDADNQNDAAENSQLASENPVFWILLALLLAVIATLAITRFVRRAKL